MKDKNKKTGFTIVELLTVLAIIALLVGVLLPALDMVRNLAKTTKQKSQFATIGQAILAFRADYGDYPPSSLDDSFAGLHYLGSQKLGEALLGWDLLGFHPDSAWRADGYDKNGGALTYDPEESRNGGDDSLDERVSTYLEPGAANAFTLEQLFGIGNTTELAPETFVLCDSFTVKSITITPNPTLPGETVTLKAGSPILYYKANTSSKTMGGFPENRRYNCYDNQELLELGSMKDNTVHPLADTTTMFEEFQQYVTDPKIEATTNRLWPHRPDSYILISAGADGLYGTSDDITNF